jgi:hypothetical protein
VVPGQNSIPLPPTIRFNLYQRQGGKLAGTPGGLCDGALCCVVGFEVLVLGSAWTVGGVGLEVLVMGAGATGDLKKVGASKLTSPRPPAIKSVAPSQTAIVGNGVGGKTCMGLPPGSSESRHCVSCCFG